MRRLHSEGLIYGREICVSKSIGAQKRARGRVYILTEGKYVLILAVRCIPVNLQASLIVGSKFTVFALFYFVFEGNFPSRNPWRAYIWRGDLTEGFLRYQFGGLIFGGGLYPEGLIFGILRYFCVEVINSKQQLRGKLGHVVKIHVYRLA